MPNTGVTLNASEMQIAFYSHTFQRYEILAPNIYVGNNGEMDLLGLRRSGYIDEIEIKISRSDFLADFKKTTHVKSEYKCIINERHQYSGYRRVTKHSAIKNGETSCNYYYFLLPVELSEKCEIPEYAGLYVCYTDNAGGLRVEEKKRAPLIHRRKISDKTKYDIGRKMAFKYWHK